MHVVVVVVVVVVIVVVSEALARVDDVIRQLLRPALDGHLRQPCPDQRRRPLQQPRVVVVTRLRILRGRDAVRQHAEADVTLRVCGQLDPRTAQVLGPQGAPVAAEGLDAAGPLEVVAEGGVSQPEKALLTPRPVPLGEGRKKKT